MSLILERIEALLSGNDLRTIGKVREIIPLIRNQSDFDALFSFMSHHDRVIRMRAADAVEKISLGHPEYLQVHVAELFDLSHSAVDKEFKWHLALLLSRPVFSKNEAEFAWAILERWAIDKSNSKIVRVNALEGLYHLFLQVTSRLLPFLQLLNKLADENIPSINARIRKIRRHLPT
ncbi:MAG TPA: hypothetical protein PKM27_13875 [Saprospiraceae bacterium]|nr:hypothetical protein [Saprospiraceae bacterium]HNT19067.1 hypothetical protein [Saprospiraceae bacterium]